MSTTIKGQITKAHHHSMTGLNMLKMIWAKECLKQRLRRKADQKMMSNILLGVKVFLISFPLK